MSRALALSVALVLSASTSAFASNRVDPVGVTASSSATGTTPAAAIDRDAVTAWRANGAPRQWIEVDLGRPLPIWKLRVQLGADGQQSGLVTTGAQSSPTHVATSWSEVVRDGEWLEASGEDGYRGGDVRYVRIEVTGGTAPAAVREIEVYTGLEYFGYFRDADPLVGIGCAPGCDRMADTADAGANLAWVSPMNGSDLAMRLAEAQALGVRAVVDLNYTCWSGTQLVMAGWREVSDALRGSPDLAVVAAIYLRDEPYNTFGSGVAVGDMQTLGAAIVADFPTIPRAAILDADSVSSTRLGRAHVAMLDWVGFDIYAPWSSAMPATIARLRALLTPEQRMIALPSTHTCPSCGAFSASTPEVWSKMIETNLDPWYAEIVSDPKYVAVVPFLWQTFLDLDGALLQTGAEMAPPLVLRSRVLAHSILGERPTLPRPSAWLGSAFAGDDPLRPNLSTCRASHEHLASLSTRIERVLRALPSTGCWLR